MTEPVSSPFLAAASDESAPTAPTMPHSRYPRSPQPAVLSVVPRNGRVLLVKRANPPDEALWGFPGGRLMLGEALAEGAIRELAEETGVIAWPRTRSLPAAFASLDVIERDSVGAIRYHFVLTAILCQWQSGEGVAADDALECRWFDMAEIQSLADAGEASKHVADIARLAFSIEQRL